MNISRLIAGALLTCALPALAQPELKPVNDLPFPLVTPDEAQKLVMPETTIKLHLHDVTLGEALAELEKQSGVALDTWAGAMDVDKKLSLDLETRSFNEAFKAILDEADVKATLGQFGGRDVWQVMFNQHDEQSDSPQSGVGVFQLRLLNLSSNSSKSVTPTKTGTAKRSQNNGLNVIFGMVSVPQATILDAPRVRITRAEDEKGRSFGIENPNHYQIGFGGGMNGPVSVALRPSTSGSQKLAHLEGVAVYVLPTKRHHWEVDDVTNAKDASHDFLFAGQKMMFSIQNAHQSGNTINLDLRLSSPHKGDNGRNLSFSYALLSSSVHVLDAKGQQLAMSSSGGSRNDNQLTMQAGFSAPGRRTPPVAMQNGKMVTLPTPETPILTGPFKLSFDIPTEFVQTQVPFSFSDVPLP